MVGKLSQILRRRTSCAVGSVAVEFALLLPWLIILAIGAIDYGTMMIRQTELEAATRAGAEYALVHPLDSTGIENTVTSYASFSPTVTATAQTFCTCADNTNFSSTSTCPPSQGSANPCAALADPRVLIYVGVQGSQAFQPVLSWGGVWPSSLTAGTVTRYQ